MLVRLSTITSTSMERQASLMLARAVRPGPSSASAARRGAAVSLRRQSAAASTSSSELTPFAESSSFTSALPAGKSKAYDLSLAYIREHQASVLSKLKKLRAQPSTPETVAAITRLEVSAFLNDPVVRREFAETDGRAHMDKPVMRYMREKKWKKEGGLDLLMQRVYQMNVVEDLTGPLSGSAEVSIASADATIEPGSVQAASLFEQPPKMLVQLYEQPATPTAEQPNPTGLFTLLVIDPDSPEYETQSFSQRIHYAKTDIPLSVLSGQTDLFTLTEGNEVLSWEPPAPPRGSGKHRYVFVLLRQTAAQPLTIGASGLAREQFDLRAFAAEQGLAVEAITLIRSAWTKDDLKYISETYEKHRGEACPIYEKPPKELRYGYPMSSKQVKKEERREQAWERMFDELEIGLSGEEGIEVKQVA